MYWLSTMAEDGGADADMGGAVGNGGLEIARHAHGEDAEPVAGGAGGEPGEMGGGIAFGWGDAHQAGQAGAEAGLACGDEGVGVGGGDAGFLRFVTDIDLNQQVRRAAFLLDCVGNGVGQAGAVEHLDDIGQADGVARLVGLQAADEVQAQSGVGGAQGGEF